MKIESIILILVFHLNEIIIHTCTASSVHELNLQRRERGEACSFTDLTLIVDSIEVPEVVVDHSLSLPISFNFPLYLFQLQESE